MKEETASMEPVEYVVLTRGELGGWSGSDSGRLGRDLAPILNDYAEQGWRVVASIYQQLILERPRRPGELAPAAAPEGRGDEVSAAGDAQAAAAPPAEE